MNDTPTSLPGNPEAEAVARLTAATTVAAEGDPSANVLALLGEKPAKEVGDE